MWPWTKKKRGPSRQEELDACIRETRQRLSQAYANFNAAKDDELLESYIYEIQALQGRYSYLLRQRKALEGGPVPSPALPVA